MKQKFIVTVDGPYPFTTKTLRKWLQEGRIHEEEHWVSRKNNPDSSDNRKLVAEAELNELNRTKVTVRLYKGE